MDEPDSPMMKELAARGISRRDFLGFCGKMAAILSLPSGAVTAIAQAIESEPKPRLLWMEFQDCAGNTESFLRASSPTAAEIILDHLSVDYHETIMAAAGDHAEARWHEAVSEHAGQYIAVVEGSIPTGAGGAYCTVAGVTALEIARQVCGSAMATIAIGNCAAFGGLPAAAPNPTGARAVGDVVPGIQNLINLPGCPANVDNLTALLVYYLTYQQWPVLDSLRRPRFAYHETIHDECPREDHFEHGQFVHAWGDDGHRRGLCLFQMGCRGPVTRHNCGQVQWNEGTSWPIGCGHPCIGCSEPDFWDGMTPFYARLSGFGGEYESGHEEEHD
jgi:hydrogenase small subunit